MRSTIYIALLICLSSTAQVGVNILSPHPSAAMQVETPSGFVKGMLTPSMTTTSRMSLASGTITPADGLIVYDVNHHMHYYYHSQAAKWVSMSPLVLSSPTSAATNFPSGVISTPISSTPTSYSVGINKLVPVQALDVVGTAAISGNLTLGSALNLGGPFNVPGFAVNPFVPSGVILMWSGNNIPFGWVECDGTNGTPDLRGRFIVAAGQAPFTTVPNDNNPNYAVNTTGGENRHTLTTAEIPKHTHQARGDNATMSASGGSHFHYANPSGQGVNASRAGGSSGGLASDGVGTIATSNETHAHPNSEFSGSTGDGTTAGLNGQGHENRPQFYVLKFIMKQ